MAKSRSGGRGGEGETQMDRDKGVRCGAAVLRCARWLAHFAPRKLDSYLKTERDEMVERGNLEARAKFSGKHFVFAIRRGQIARW